MIDFKNGFERVQKLNFKIHTLVSILSHLRESNVWFEWTKRSFIDRYTIIENKKKNPTNFDCPRLIESLNPIIFNSTHTVVNQSSLNISSLGQCPEGFPRLNYEPTSAHPPTPKPTHNPIQIIQYIAGANFDRRPPLAN